MPTTKMILTILAVFGLVVAFKAAGPASAAQGCPTYWPTVAEHEGFFTDTAGGRWFIIIATDDNGYTTGRAYVADHGYDQGYDPSPVSHATLARGGQPVTEVQCRVGDGAYGEPIPYAKVLRLHGPEPQGMDPLLPWHDQVYLHEVYEGLVLVSPDMTVQPNLAQNWMIADEGRTYTFNLDAGATFHDGRSVTAHDVKWSFERAATPGVYGHDIFFGNVVGATAKFNGDSDGLDGITVVDDRTLRIELVKPAYDLPARLSYHQAHVVDRHTVDSENDWRQVLNGTGPFRLEEYVPGERLVLERHTGYHGPQPRLDKLHFSLVSACECEELYEAGALDLWRVPWYLAGKYSEHPDLHRGPVEWHNDYLLMNPTKAPFDDLNVRLALNYAVNRAEFPASEVGAVPAFTIVPPGMSHYGVDGYDYDPERARELLATSKYGADLASYPTITLTVPGCWCPVNEAVLDSWIALGLPVETVSPEGGWPEYFNDLGEGRYQLANGNWVVDYPEVSSFLYDLFHSDGFQSYYAGDPELDALLDRALGEPDIAARNELFRQAELRLTREIAHWVPLYHHERRFYLARPGVTGLPLAPMSLPLGRYVDIAP